MNPQQDYLGPNHNPYDFIMNPGKPPKKGFSAGLPPLALKILLVLGGVFLVMVLVAIVLSFGSSKSIGKAELIGLAQTQQEIIRISDEGASAAVQQTTKNLATTAVLAIQTQQTQLLTLLEKNGIKTDDKQLALKQDANTDLKFKEATATSTFDTTFSQVIEEQLRAYAVTLQAYYNKTGSKSQRDMFGTDYTQAQLLLSQVPYTRNALGSQ